METNFIFFPFSFPVFRDLANDGDETKLEKAETSYGSRTYASRRDGKIEGGRCYYDDERMVIVGLGSTYFFLFASYRACSGISLLLACLCFTRDLTWLVPRPGMTCFIQSNSPTCGRPQRMHVPGKCNR